MAPLLKIPMVFNFFEVWVWDVEGRVGVFGRWVELQTVLIDRSGDGFWRGWGCGE